MRLLAEIIVIAALIYVGWDKPFKDRAAQALAMVSSKYHATESSLQKHANPRSNTEPQRIAADLHGFFRLVNGSALDCRQWSVNGTQQQHLGDDPVSFRGLIKQCIRSLLQ